MVHFLMVNVGKYSYYMDAMGVMVTRTMTCFSRGILIDLQFPCEFGGCITPKG